MNSRSRKVIDIKSIRHRLKMSLVFMISLQRQTYDYHFYSQTRMIYGDYMLQVSLVVLLYAVVEGGVF